MKIFTHDNPALISSLAVQATTHPSRKENPTSQVFSLVFMSLNSSKHSLLQ